MIFETKPAMSNGFENRQDLLGHKSGRITDHYCQAEIAELRDSVEKLSRVNLA